MREVITHDYNAPHVYVLLTSIMLVFVNKLPSFDIPISFCQ
jgi:hypothetical protein